MEFIKKLRKFFKEKVTGEEIKKAHNMLRIFTVIAYLTVLALWMIYEITTYLFLGLLLTVMIVRVIFALWLYKKKFVEKSL